MSPDNRWSPWRCVALATLALFACVLARPALAEDEAELLIAASRQARAAKNPAESERLARQALEIADKDPLNSQAAKQGEAWNLIGLARLESGNPAGSVEPLQKALAAFEREPELHAERILVALFNLTLVHLELKDYVAAAETSRRRIKLLEKSAPDSNVLVEDWLRLGRALAGGKEYEGAVAAVTRAKEIVVQRDGPITALVANLNDRLAEVWEQQDKYAEAEPLYRESLTIRRELFADSAHEDVFNSLYRLGDNRRLAGDLKQAQDLFAQTDVKMVRRYGPDATQRVVILQLRRDVAKQLGDAAVEADCQKLLDRLKKVGEWEQTLPEIAANFTLEQLAEADSKLTAALDSAREFGAESMPVFYAQFRRARWQQLQGKDEAALPVFDETLRVGRAVFGDNHPEIAAMHMLRAESLERLQRMPEAQTGYEAAAAANIASGFPDLKMQMLLAGRLTNLGLATKNQDLSILWFTRERRLRADLAQPPDPLYGKNLNEVGVLHAGLGDWTKAEEHFAASLAILEPRLQPDAPLLATVRQNLAFARQQLAAAAAPLAPQKPAEVPLVSEPVLPPFADPKLPPLAAIPPPEPPAIPSEAVGKVFDFGFKVLFAVVIGAIIGYQAWRRGYFPLTWLAAFVASCTTPIITACLLAALPDKRIQQRRERERRWLAAQLRATGPARIVPTPAAARVGSLGDEQTRT